ncbi:MAG: hypothetical protein PUI22_02440 [Bacteroidales bacterium]|nr:hypothetical protein [Bacteroidales bacterium]MDY5263280.1 hypothetical protein [Candidatus Cryptobacteroides sp.]
MSAHEIFLLVIIGLSILLDFRVKSRRKKRSAASSEKRARPSVPEFPTVSNLPLPAGEDEDLTWENEDLTGEAEEPVGESGEPVPAAEEAGESLVAEETEEALPQTYSPVVSGSFEVPDVLESAEDETPAVAAGGEKSPAIPEGDRREAIDPKKLVIYSEIMSPKFKEF